MGNVVQAGVGQAPARQATVYAGQLHQRELSIYLKEKYFASIL